MNDSVEALPREAAQTGVDPANALLDSHSGETLWYLWMILRSNRADKTRPTTESVFHASNCKIRGGNNHA